MVVGVNHAPVAVPPAGANQAGGAGGRHGGTAARSPETGTLPMR